MTRDRDWEAIAHNVVPRLNDDVPSAPFPGDVFTTAKIREAVATLRENNDEWFCPTCSDAYYVFGASRDACVEAHCGCGVALVRRRAVEGAP